MKIWKTTLITVIAFLGISTTLLYTSCEKDSCLDLKCKNGGSCADGFCRCKTGFEGAECEINSADKFLGLFIGQRGCVGSPIDDTVLIYLDQYPNKVKLVQFSKRADTLTGTADGITLNLDPYARDNYRRVLSGTKLSGQNYEKLSITNEFIADVTVSTQKEVCNFYGFR